MSASVVLPTRAGGELRLRPGRPAIMGIVNVTPDSFSDGGKWLNPEDAADHALRLLDDGADVVDIGGESTRPGARETPADREIQRVVPVIERILRKRPDAALSIDTRKARVALRAWEAGASIINDVSGMAHDPDMAPLVSRLDVPVALMHMRATPETMQEDIHWDDLLGDVKRELRRAVERALASGVRSERIILDPGIGFGKTVRDNLQLIARLDEIAALGYPVLLGVSRKSFIGKTVGGDHPLDRREGTLAAELVGARRGASMIRTHDVRATRRALDMAALLADAGETVR